MGLLAKTLAYQLEKGTLPPMSKEDEKILSKAVNSLWDTIDRAIGYRVINKKNNECKGDK
jgi:hypothetical protein